MNLCLPQNLIDEYLYYLMNLEKILNFFIFEKSFGWDF